MREIGSAFGWWANVRLRGITPSRNKNNTITVAYDLLYIHDDCNPCGACYGCDTCDNWMVLSVVLIKMFVMIVIILVMTERF